MKKLMLITALLCGSAHAEFKDGNKLLQDMYGSHGNQMNALGYVIGVADALMNVSYCPPESVTAGQVHDMVKQYLENNPSMRHNSGDRIVHLVLRTAWPCANRRGGQSL